MGCSQKGWSAFLWAAVFIVALAACSSKSNPPQNSPEGSPPPAGGSGSTEGGDGGEKTPDVSGGGVGSGPSDSTGSNAGGGDEKKAESEAGGGEGGGGDGSGGGGGGGDGSGGGGGGGDGSGGGGTGGENGGGTGGGVSPPKPPYTATVRKTLTGSYGPMFGWAVGSAGDMNGDGVNDYAVASSIGGTSKVVVYSGKDDTVIYSLTSGADSVESAGDINNDGKGDLVIWSGAVRVISGATGLLLNDIIDVSGEGGLTGKLVSKLGDLNGDGRNDFAFCDYRFENNKGRVVIVSGADGSTIGSLQGGGAENRFGWALDEVGDLNGDGMGDFIVGAINAGGIAADGKAYLYSGSDRSLLATLEGDPDGIFRYDYGADVAGIGDIDGDGVGDFIVSSIERTMSRGGIVYVYSGKTRAQIKKLVGSVLFGTSLSGLGDVNGDGTPDFLVGDREVDSAFVYSGKTGEQLAKVGNGRGQSIFGKSVAGVGDLNGDGKGDFIVGAPLIDEAYVYLSQ